jgi:hypothetical protein
MDLSLGSQKLILLMPNTIPNLRNLFRAQTSKTVASFGWCGAKVGKLALVQP